MQFTRERRARRHIVIFTVSLATENIRLQSHFQPRVRDFRRFGARARARQLNLNETTELDEQLGTESPRESGQGELKTTFAISSSRVRKNERTKFINAGTVMRDRSSFRRSDSRISCYLELHPRRAQIAFNSRFILSIAHTAHRSVSQKLARAGVRGPESSARP